jgi:hypothetical protein
MDHDGRIETTQLQLNGRSLAGKGKYSTAGTRGATCAGAQDRARRPIYGAPLTLEASSWD